MRRRRGLTLVELMISVALGLVIMGMVMYSFHNANMAVRRSLALIDVGEQELLINRLMAADFEKFDAGSAISLARTTSGNTVLQTLRFRTDLRAAPDLSCGLNADGQDAADNYAAPEGRWVGYEFELDKDARVRRRYTDENGNTKTQYSWPVVVRRGHMVANPETASDIDAQAVAADIPKWPVTAAQDDEWPKLTLGTFWTRWQNSSTEPDAVVGLYCNDDGCSPVCKDIDEKGDEVKPSERKHFCAKRDIDQAAYGATPSEKPSYLRLNLMIVGRVAQEERQRALKGDGWLPVAGSQECDLEAMLFGNG